MRKGNYHSQGVKGTAVLEKRELERKRRMERRAAAMETAGKNAIAEFLDQCSENELEALRCTIHFARSAEPGKSLPERDRKRVSEYLNTGYKMYSRMATEDSVRHYRIMRSRILRRVTMMFIDSDQFDRVADMLLDIAVCDAEVKEFAGKRQAMRSYYSKDGETGAQPKARTTDLKERKGGDSDESRPHTQHDHEPVRTSP